MKQHINFNFRFLSSFNVKVGSHSKQRAVHREMYGDNWTVEMHPFLKKIDATKYEATDTAWAYVQDLNIHVSKRLDLLDG